MSPPYEAFFFDLFVLFAVLAGGSVWLGRFWLGRWYNWSDQLHDYSRWPATPWAALVFVYLRVLMVFHSVDRDLFAYIRDSHPDLLLAPGFIFGGISLSVMVFRFPKWALPPWYRERLKARQAEKDSGDESTR